MTPDRETILAAAQQLTEQNQFARALDEYRKLLAVDPNDAKILLRVGDLQMRAADYGGAIATYDRVARLYADQGFALKAVAVYKQIRELLLAQRQDLLPSFGHVLDHLVQLFVGLGVPQDALQLLDEEAIRLRKANSEEGALEMYRRMTHVAPNTPLPFLRLAESLCRIGSIDDALASFGHASQLLLSAGRHEDALRVMERMLHFRPDPAVAFAAAKLYLAKGTVTEGMQALSRIQVCFQADPNNLDVLDLLAQAFDVIEQPDKAREVRKELARLAREQGDHERHEAVLRDIEPASGVADSQAPNIGGVAPAPPSFGPRSPATNDAVFPVTTSRAEPTTRSTASGLGMPPPKPRREAPALPPPPSAPVSSAVAPSSAVPPLSSAALAVPMPPVGKRPSVPPPPPLAQVVALAASQQPASQVPAPSASSPESTEERVSRLSREIAEVTSHPPAAAIITHADEGVDSLDDLDLVEEQDAPSRLTPAAPSVHAAPSIAPPSIAPQAFAQLPSAEHSSNAHSTHSAGALLPVPPRAAADVDVAVVTRQTLSKAQGFRARGQFFAAIETLQNGLEQVPRSIELRESLRDVFAESGNRDGAIEEMLTMAAIYVEYGRPDHAGTVLRNILEAEPEHAPALRALGGLSRVQQIHSSRPPSALLQSQYPTASAQGPASQMHPAAQLQQLGLADQTAASVEEALEEADFFASRGMYGDARRILLDQLQRTPGNPLVVELLSEMDERRPADGDTVNESSRDSDFNLKEQLSELGRVVRESQVPPKMGAPKQQVDVESVFLKFKQGVRAQVADSDSATHYDLGLAYKEMNLVEDAIEELKLAARDVTRECNCYAMIGLIYGEQKQWEQSRKFYSKGLGAVRRTPAQETALYYELGNVSEMAEHLDQAAYYFRQVLRRDPSFRDARERLGKLRTSWAPPESRTTGGNQDEEVDRAFDDLLSDQ